jgi:hypothetical protein
MDTPGGAAARWVAFFLACLAAAVELARMSLAALTPASPDEPAKAIYWWVVQLIIYAVSALISYALRPKQEAPKPQEGKAPVINDGLAVRDVFGTVWIDDEFLLAWKIMGHDKIKSKGGKK